ncbi:unnamed protein product [Tuber aestivum]|uniref:Ubiquitin-like domain-containing protein n=1 Tax=Tuber aestivum TaxID=59557 RepID=A0A292PLL7_9PEZI|nr:unnamed protein product [Tuber aestivum]
MSSSTAEGFNPPEVPVDVLLIKVMSPVSGFPRDLTFRMLATSTIKDVKDQIAGSLDSRPPCDQQRLIYRGKMMQDESRLETVLGLDSGQVGSDLREAFTFHLMLPPPPSPVPAPAPATTPIVQDTLPNASTFHTRPGPITPIFSEQIPEEGTAHSGPGGLARSGLQRPEGLQQQLRQRREHLNSRLGPDQASSSGASAPGASNYDLAPGSETSASMTPTRTLSAANTDNGDFYSGSLYGPSRGYATSRSEPVAPSQARVEQRQPYERPRERPSLHDDTTTPPFTHLSPPPEQLPVFHLPANNPHPITRTSPVYLLQDVSGRPRALLLGPPRGTNPTLAEVINDLRGPLGPPGAGLPDLRELGLPPLPDLANLGAVGGIAGNNLLGAGLGLGDHFGGAHAHHRVGFHGAALERPRRIGRLNLPDLIHGVRAHASNFWLAVRLAVFVILFTGSGGWRRMLYLGSVAVAIFVWQTGVLEPFLRPIIDTINPPPPPAQPPAPGPTQQVPDQPQPQAAAGNPNHGNPPLEHAADANANQLDPARTAQMLIDRQQNRFRDIFRGIERCIMIFLASLIPGLHERHVDAVEQRQRDETQRQQLLQHQQHQQAGAAGSGDMEVNDEGEGGAGAGAGQVPPPAPQPEPQMDEVDVDPLVVL